MLYILPELTEPCNSYLYLLLLEQTDALKFDQT